MLRCRIVSFLGAVILFGAGVSPAATTSVQNPGANAIVTQKGLDYAKQLALPILLNLVADAPLPNPLASGTDYHVDWKVTDTKLSDLDATATIGLDNPTDSIVLNLAGLKFKVEANVYAKSTIFPHPHVSAKAHASSTKSTASITSKITYDDAKAVPVLATTACSAKVDVDVTISGLGILDQLADYLIAQFKHDISKAIEDAFCSEGIKEAVDLANEAFGALSYDFDIDLPAPLKPVMADMHLAGNPAVDADAAGLTYYKVPVIAELFDPDGTHSGLVAPVMPQLSKGVMASRMVTGEVSNFPINTALWTLTELGCLTYTITQSDLPSEIQDILNTSFYGTVVPQLQKEYPNHAMTLTFNSSIPPVVQLDNAGLSLIFTTDLVYNVVINASASVPAFTLESKGNAAANVTASSDGKIRGSVGAINFQLSVKDSAVGHISSLLVKLLAAPIKLAIDFAVLPMVNRYLARGFALPEINVEVDGYKIKMRFVDPLIDYSVSKSLLIGTNTVVSITPTSTAGLRHQRSLANMAPRSRGGDVLAPEP